MRQPTTKADLLKKMHQAHEILYRTLARIPDERMDEIALYDNWTIKDFLAHIGAWQHSAAERVAGLRQGTWAGLGATLDEINERILEQHRHEDLLKVRQFERQGFNALIAEVEKASEDDLFSPNRFETRAGEPLVDLIAGDSYEHYDEHLDDVRAWMRQNGFD